MASYYLPYQAVFCGPANDIHPKTLKLKQTLDFCNTVDLLYEFSLVVFKVRLSYELASNNEADIKWLEMAFESPC